MLLFKQINNQFKDLKVVHYTYKMYINHNERKHIFDNAYMNLYQSIKQLINIVRLYNPNRTFTFILKKQTNKQGYVNKGT